MQSRKTTLLSGVEDGLGIFKNISGVERKIKELLEIFKNNGLSITVKSNLKTANFLDMHFDLVKEIYQPYKKSNDDPFCINKRSSNPPSILQKIPKSISKRISEILSNEYIFNQSISYYENALKKGSYNLFLKYTPTQNQEENNQQREQKKWKIIWFSAKYSLNLKTNIGKLFLKLLNCHCPRASKFHKIFNRNAEKSYITINMGPIISSNNKEVLQARNQHYG